MLQLNHFNKENTELRIGNPGTGKTRSIVTDIEDAYMSGIPLHKMALFSHSNAAVDEARDRVLSSLSERYNLLAKHGDVGDLLPPQRSDTLWFRTTHSVSFRCLDLSPDALLSEFQCREFGKMSGIPMSGITSKKDGYNPKAITLKGDKYLHWIGTAKVKGQSIRDYVINNKLEKDGADITQLEQLDKRYQLFKQQNLRYDFNDMLVLAGGSDNLDIPDLDLLVIDEAQDLNPMQWIICDKFASKAKRVIIAGDDKQAINDFAGAVPDVLLTLNARVTSLQQSYRVPLAIYTVANRIRDKYIRRYRKEGAQWRPRSSGDDRNVDGTFRIVPSLPLLQILAKQKETWFLQGRTRSVLREFREALLRRTSSGETVIFAMENGAPVEIELYELYSIYHEAMKKNTTPSDLLTLKAKASLAKKIDIEVRSKFLGKLLKCKPQEALVRFKEFNSDYLLRNPDIILDFAFKQFAMSTLGVTSDEVEYVIKTYDQFLLKGNKLFTEANIQIGTIHSFKGREADNTVILMDVPTRVTEVILDGDTDIEARILYTAITRAKKTCWCWEIRKSCGNLSKYLS